MVFTKVTPNYDSLWELTHIFDLLNDACSKYYTDSEYLAVEEVTVLFKGRIIFKQYIPKRHMFWNKNIQII
jgi:hypothetical protein